MKATYRSAMEATYLACMVIAGIAMVVMTLVVPYGVFTRYVLNAASSWPEPLAILMMIVFTFFGAAACLRANVHIAVKIFTNPLPAALRQIANWLVMALLVLLSLFMVVWGVRLCEATWHQYLAEFTWLRVGITYMPIPLGGALSLLFLIELAWLGPPGEDSFIHREPTSAD